MRRVNLKVFGLVVTLLASCAMLIPAKADIASGFGKATLGGAAATVSAYCPQGQSSAVVSVGTGLSVSTITVYTAANVGSQGAPAPGPTGAPAWAYAATVPNTNANTITNSGKLYVSLASDSYIYAVVTTYGSGSATGTITCTAAVAMTHGPFVTPAPGSSGFVILYPTPQAASDPSQLGSTYIGGGYFSFGQTATPSPFPSASGPAGFSLNATGNATFQNNYDDGSGQTHNAYTYTYNNQGTQVNALVASRNGNATLTGGKFLSNVISVPPTPVPTCAPGGSNAQTQYFVKENYVNAAGKSNSSGEATVTCAANTLLQVPLSGTNFGTAKFWTVSASTTTNTEKEQTQGTSPSSGTNIPLVTTTWTSTVTLAGATNASAADSTLGCWGDGAGTQMQLCPEGTSFFNNPLNANANVVAGTTVPGTLGPVYGLTNAAVGGTFHCVWGTATATSSTATFSWSANEAFATAGNWVVTLYDKTTATPRMATALGSVSTTGFTIGTTGASDVMYAEVCGL